MTRIYLITEGVHDVAYLSRILVSHFKLKQAAALTDLDDVYRRWIEESCKWPHQGKIDRSSVPAPEFYVGPGMAVALANAEGLDSICEKLQGALEHFAKTGASLDAIGVVLDADDEDPAVRRQKMATRLDAELMEASLPRPPRTGVFILPDDTSPGSLEDVLIPLGRRLFPGLFASADLHIQAAYNELDNLRSDERKAFRKPSGPSKALLSAVAAILKPGKAIQATLKDHRWISKETLSAPELAPTIEFLQRLLSKDPQTAIAPQTPL